MKLAMCLLIVVISAYLGRLLSKRMAQRLDFFRDYLSAMTQLSDKVVGVGLELYKALAECRGDVVGLMFRECAARLKRTPQMKLEVIWARSLTHCRDSLAFLNKADLQFLAEGGGALEALCANPSEKQAAIFLKRLADHIVALELEKNKKTRLYNTAGVLAGLMIALLVI
jgi:stage III sporulation protein AB